MKRAKPQRSAAFGAVMALMAAAGTAGAADGTWTNLVNAQLWSAGANWSNNVVADGSSSTADFTTVNIAADTMVRLDSPRTMGTLLFGDSWVTNKLPAGWILDNNGNRANVLTLGGAATITVNALSTGRCAAVNVALAAGSGWAKAGTGTLSVAGAGNNSLPINQNLAMNGGTLDLGSNRQYVATVSGAGGWVTGSGTLTIHQPGGTAITLPTTFSGALQVNVVRPFNVNSTGDFNLSLTGDSVSTGSLTLFGGDNPTAQPSGYDKGVFNGLALKDGGRLSGVTGLTLNNGTLFLHNNASYAPNGGTATTSSQDMGDRVNDAAAITLNGGRIWFKGRDSTASTEALGTLTAGSGMGVIYAYPGSSAGAELTLASLARVAGATLEIDGTSLGTTGNSTRIFVTAALGGNLAPVGAGVGIVPGVFSGYQTLIPLPVGYVSGKGFVPLGTADGPTSYTGDLAAAATTDNVYNPSAYVVKTAGQTINSLVQSGNITFDAGTPGTLTIASGMFIQATGNLSIGTPTTRGQLTSGLGSGELFLVRSNGAGGGQTLGNTRIDTVIADNGGTRVKLVIVQYCRDNLNANFCMYASNTYSGGTVVSGGNTYYLYGGAESGGVAPVPAANDPTQGLIINNTGVTMQNTAQQIAAANIVTLNGGSILTLTGNNTLAGLVFNSNGGFARNPQVNASGSLTLTGGITSTPADPSVVPTVSTGTLDLNGTTNHVFAVNAMLANPSLVGLQISSTIQNGGFTKAGAGVLYLSANNTYTNETRVAGGVLRANSGAGLPTASLLTLSGGVLETSGTLARTNGAAANHMRITGGASGFSAYGGALTVAFGSTGAPTALTWGDALFNPSALVLNDLSASDALDFKNAINLGASNRAVNVNANTATLSGSLSGSGGGLTKGGTGTLVLNAANTYNGPTAVNGGALVLGASGSIANSKSLTVAAGAVLDVTAKGTHTMQTDETYTLGVDPAGAGSAGRIVAAGLDITAGKVVINVTGTLDDSIYVLATCTSMAGGKFASVTGSTPGYRLVYGDNYIALARFEVKGMVLVVR